LLTLKAILPADLDVGLMALSRRAPGGGDWLFPLHC
jgi:hypothetical protein